MKRNFKNKVIWIVGASSGIGRSIAIELSKQNVTLILSARNEESLKELAGECSTNGSQSMVQILDQQDPKSLNEAARIVLDSNPRIDYVFLNAGISQRSLASETIIDVDRKIMEINYFGAIQISKMILPRFVEQGFGHFVVTSSLTGRMGFPLRSSYAASKHALHGYFDSLRTELYGTDIDITIVCPGLIKTDISLHAVDGVGEQTGEMDKGQENGMLPEVFTKKLLKAVIRKKRDVVIGNKEILMVYIRKYFPFLFYKLVSTINPR